MDKKLKDQITTFLSVAIPIILGVVLTYQANIMGYVAQYGPTSVAIVGAILAVISAYYSKVAGKAEGKTEALGNSKPEDPGAV